MATPGRCPPSESNPTEPSNPCLTPFPSLVRPSFPSTGGSPPSSFPLPFRHSSFPLVIPTSLSSFRRKPESRGQKQPPWGDVRRCRGMTSGNPLPSPPPEGEGIGRKRKWEKRWSDAYCERLSSRRTLYKCGQIFRSLRHLYFPKESKISSPPGRGLEPAPDVIRGRGSPDVTSNADCLPQQGAAPPGFPLSRE